LTDQPESRPNIIVILADDMGFADLGCWGSEIRTPNIDKLAAGGIKYTQMYNSARCCPSRAALLTGLNPQQAGVGHMVDNYGTPEYQGYLNDNCVTIAEALSASGYETLMSGKWHVGGPHNLQKPETWTPGEPGSPTPRQRGFDKFFGTLTGAGSFWNPMTLMEDQTLIQPDSPDFYYTDAISDHAIEMISGNADSEKPFFLYLAYTSPHWPLHAFEEDIARYEGKYRDGWDSLRTSRHESMRSLGLVDPKWEISKRDPDSPAWDETPNHDWEDLRMAVYAAQIDRMDQGIGRVLAQIEAQGQTDNTLIMFMADNGGCAEFCAEDSNRPNYAAFNTPNLDGSRATVGNIPDLRPGGSVTFQSYDLPWANTSNTPFRLFKRWTHEGGISTPLIVNWPDKIKSPETIHSPAHLIDIMPTCLQAAGASYPTENNDHAIKPLEGESLVPSFQNPDWKREAPIHWEHEGNRAMRDGDWKLVSENPGAWELYNISDDRTELNNRADGEKDRLTRMSREYDAWGERIGIVNWVDRWDRIGRGPIGKRNHRVG
jgi:arylsulfatase